MHGRTSALRPRVGVLSRHRAQVAARTARAAAEGVTRVFGDSHDTFAAGTGAARIRATLRVAAARPQPPAAASGDGDGSGVRISVDRVIDALRIRGEVASMAAATSGEATGGSLEELQELVDAGLALKPCVPESLVEVETFPVRPPRVWVQVSGKQRARYTETPEHQADGSVNWIRTLYPPAVVTTDDEFARTAELVGRLAAQTRDPTVVAVGHTGREGLLEREAEFVSTLLAATQMGLTEVARGSAVRAAALREPPRLLEACIALLRALEILHGLTPAAPGPMEHEEAARVAAVRDAIEARRELDALITAEKNETRELLEAIEKARTEASALERELEATRKRTAEARARAEAPLARSGEQESFSHERVLVVGELQSVEKANVLLEAELVALKSRAADVVQAKVVSTMQAHKVEAEIKEASAEQLAILLALAHRKSELEATDAQLAALNESIACAEAEKEVQRIHENKAKFVASMKGRSPAARPALRRGPSTGGHHRRASVTPSSLLTTSSTSML
ncbi:uncharacterized protein AMSG_00958 [Thecamonas trahens ATCC 50062]|uniref:Uncharacterized protein n=1 Tax=Thecamonas trahens ATCC 50062 TaxID=461836 RepID=A0A0L0DIM0_THETB|nr:hypothetical protein AMSG_00958 [Thecamonas trahens ATCC 50062]KNC52132.1 hypothetical protein AMSG_00958 [Thecamonas trahens ATCC 50062]|eukprot:XP_013762136.1 hypothetical protein AMSG_00958 [Thecamonas trahens ATCC 50062]